MSHGQSPGAFPDAIAFIAADVRTAIMGQTLQSNGEGEGKLQDVIKPVGDCARGGRVGGKKGAKRQRAERCGFFLKMHSRDQSNMLPLIWHVALKKYAKSAKSERSWW